MPEMASAIGALKENQGGVSLRVLTKSDYDALESHDSATVYYVIDGNKISQYLGDTKLSAGTAATVGSAVQIYSGASESKIVTKS
jgi:hypothetical protein